MREQRDKENSRCKESGEKQNESPLEEKKLELRLEFGEIVKSRMKWAGTWSE